MGRKPTAFAKRDEVIKLVKDGVNPTDISRQLGIGRASLEAWERDQRRSWAGRVFRK
jgi:hypothetical protein